MKRYYLLRGSSEPKVLGVRNGIKQAEIKKSGYRDPEKFDRLMEVLGAGNYFKMKDSPGVMNFEIQYAEMLPKAKWTDFLMFGPYLIHCPFFISEKVANVFSQRKILNHRLFPAVVSDGSASREYKLFFIEHISDDNIDFSRSIYSTGNDLAGKTFHTFKSAEEKDALWEKSFGALEAEKIYLSARFDGEADLFVLSGSNIVISENLKNDLEDSCACSGVRILPAFGEVRWPVVLGHSHP